MSNFVFYIYYSNSKKTIFKSNKYRDTLFEYKKIAEINKKNVVFPRQYISNCKEVRFDKTFIVFAKRNAQGVQQILKYQEYYIEEKFYVYGLKKRLDFLSIIEYILSKFQTNFTMIRMFKNKIIFECGDTIECILTKNENDCKRLYFSLKNFFKEKKIIWLLCVGKVPEKSKKMKSELIQKLVNFTGLSHYQFKRRKTRH